MFDDLKGSVSRPDRKRESKDKDKDPSLRGARRFDTEGQKEVEDIFAATDGVPSVAHSDSARKPDVFQPKKTPVAASSAREDHEKGDEPNLTGNAKKYVALAVIILAAVAVLAGGWYAYSKFFAPDGGFAPNDDLSGGWERDDDGTAREDGEQEKSAKEEERLKNKPVKKSADKDRDGLSDDEEAILGTNANNVDSDGDGLFDREEAKVYKTNPLVADTDGDGFLDGEEVKNGYNPNGPGRLYEIRR